MGAIFRLLKSEKCIFLPIVENQKSRKKSIFLTFSNYFARYGSKYPHYGSGIIELNFHMIRRVILIPFLASCDTYRARNTILQYIYHYQNHANIYVSMLTYTLACLWWPLKSILWYSTPHFGYQNKSTHSGESF